MGDKFGGLRAQWTSVCARLHEGDYASEFERALSNVVLFLQKNAAFWSDFIGGNGEVDLILNHTIYQQDEEGDKCFELYLAPAFLGDLSARGIGLTVQGWQAGVKTKVTLPPRRVSLG